MYWASVLKLFEVFIAILTSPNLTGSNRPLSPFFHTPGGPLFLLSFFQVKKRNEEGTTFEPNKAVIIWPNLI